MLSMALSSLSVYTGVDILHAYIWRKLAISGHRVDAQKCAWLFATSVMRLAQEDQTVALTSHTASYDPHDLLPVPISESACGIPPSIPYQVDTVRY